MEGQFSVQLAGDNPFGRLPVDQTTEVTVNKDTKIAGGVTKFSLKTEAVNRFYLTAEFRSAFFGQLRDMVQVRRLSFHHDEMQTPRIIKDEVDVKAVAGTTLLQKVRTLSAYQQPREHLTMSKMT